MKKTGRKRIKKRKGKEERGDTADQGEGERKKKKGMGALAP